MTKKSFYQSGVSNALETDKLCSHKTQPFLGVFKRIYIQFKSNDFEALSKSQMSWAWNFSDSPGFGNSAKRAVSAAKEMKVGSDHINVLIHASISHLKSFQKIQE